MKTKFFILSILIFGYLPAAFFLGKYSKSQALVAQKEIESTPIPTSTPQATTTPQKLSSTPIQKPTTTPTVTKTPTPTPKPLPATSQEINGFIERFSAQYGIDPNVIRYIAICESGFNSNAQNGSYKGLFQFKEITWKNIRKEMNEDTRFDLVFSPEEAVQTATYAYSKGKTSIWPNCVP